MSRVQGLHAEFNRKLVITDNGSRISSFGGLMMVREFMGKIQWNGRITECVPFEDWRVLPTHRYEDLLSLGVMQRITGFATDTSMNILRQDPIWLKVWDGRLPAQATMTRFFQTFRQNLPALAGLHALALQLANIKLKHMRGNLVLDMDSTHFDTFGHQEGAAFNGHYQAVGYHPWVVYEGRTGLLLDIQLRSGEVFTSVNAGSYLDDLLVHYRERSVTLRGDSGFATPEVYEAAERNGVNYVIKFRDNELLKGLSPDIVSHDPAFWDDEREHYYVTQYQAASWSRPRRLIIVAQKKVENLDVTYQYFLTSLRSPAKTVVQFYRKRGQMENYIKETKGGFFANQLSSSNFFVNEARMMVACLAYNLMQLMRLLVFPPRQRLWQIDTIRTHLLYIAASVADHARQTWINLTRGHPGQPIFWKILKNVQAMRV